MKAGFDVTLMPEGCWENLCHIFNIDVEPVCEEGFGFTWHDKNGNIIVTQNNPVTGEYAGPSHRDDEKGFCSYIGIEGETTFVNPVFTYIERNAEYIKGSCYGTRDFI